MDLRQRIDQRGYYVEYRISIVWYSNLDVCSCRCMNLDQRGYYLVYLQFYLVVWDCRYQWSFVCMDRRQRVLRSLYGTVDVWRFG